MAEHKKRKSGGGRIPDTKVIEPAIIRHMRLTHESGVASSRNDVAAFCKGQLQQLTGKSVEADQYKNVAEKSSGALRKWFKRLVDRYSLSKYVKAPRAFEGGPAADAVTRTAVATGEKRKLSDNPSHKTTRPTNGLSFSRGSSGMPAPALHPKGDHLQKPAVSSALSVDEDLPSLASLLGSNSSPQTRLADLSDAFVSSFQGVSLGHSYAGPLSCGSSFFASKPKTWATKVWTIEEDPPVYRFDSYGSPLALLLSNSVEPKSLGITPPLDFNVDDDRLAATTPDVGCVHDQQIQSTPTVCVIPVCVAWQDLECLKPNRPLIGSIMSLYIELFIPATPLVATFDTQLFDCLAGTMDYRDWRWDGATPWTRHQYIQIPVNFENCWSFVVVENSTGGDTVVYHNGREDIADAVMHGLNGIQNRRLVSDGTYSAVAIDYFPKPNLTADSGLQTLHFMREIARVTPSRGDRSFVSLVQEECVPIEPDGCNSKRRELLNSWTSEWTV